MCENPGPDFNWAAFLKHVSMYCISENCSKILLKDVICPASTWAVYLLCFVYIRLFSWKRREKSEARFTISLWRHRRDLIKHVSQWSICQLMHHYLSPVQKSLQIWKRYSTEQLQTKMQFWKWKVNCCLRGDTAMPSRCVTECERNSTWVIQKHHNSCRDFDLLSTAGWMCLLK